MILVCGATGTIGSRVASALAAQGQEVRAVSRRSPTNPIAGINYVAADLSKSGELTQILAGVDKLFLLTAIGPAQQELEIGLASAAAQHGVTQIVKLSVMGAGSASGNAFGRLHFAIEEHIRTLGVNFAFLRPNMLMQNLAWYNHSLAAGVLPLPLAHAKVSHVDASDVAATAVALLSRSQLPDEAFTLTGLAALDGNQVSAALSSVVGREIQYTPPSLTEFAAALRSLNHDEWTANAELELFREWSSGAGSPVSSDLPELLDRPATSLESWAARELVDVLGRQ